MQTKFIGARLEPGIAKIIEQTAKEEKLDKSTALKQLIQYGRQKMLEKKEIELYRAGKISVDKAAEVLSITIPEAMTLFASAGIKSEETLEDYKNGLKMLLKGA